MFVAVRNSGCRLTRSFTLIQMQAAGYDECDDPGQRKPGRAGRKREDFINMSCDKQISKCVLLDQERIIVFLVCTLTVLVKLLSLNIF